MKILGNPQKQLTTNPQSNMKNAQRTFIQTSLQEEIYVSVYLGSLKQLLIRMLNPL